MDLPKNIFEVDGKFDAEMIKEGNTVPMMDSNGNRMNGSVLEVKDDIVVMDFNHPLAGETLHFSGEVIDVHEPRKRSQPSPLPQVDAVAVATIAVAIVAITTRVVVVVVDATK